MSVASSNEVLSVGEKERDSNVRERARVLRSSMCKRVSSIVCIFGCYYYLSAT